MDVIPVSNPLLLDPRGTEGDNMNKIKYYVLAGKYFTGEGLRVAGIWFARRLMYFSVNSLYWTTRVGDAISGEKGS